MSAQWDTPLVGAHEFDHHEASRIKVKPGAMNIPLVEADSGSLCLRSKADLADTLHRCPIMDSLNEAGTFETLASHSAVGASA